MNLHTYHDCEVAAEYIRKRFKTIPDVAILLTPGLKLFLDVLTKKIDIPFSEIPSFPRNVNQVPELSLSFGQIGHKTVLIQNGYPHYYTGYSPEATVFPTRVYKILGIKTLITTCAVGGINESFERGDIVLITDHINFFDISPLKGMNEKEFGERFVDMSQAYSQRLISLAEKYNPKIKKGIYAFMPGPNYETPAEIRALRLHGADVVGMAVVSNVIAAAHMGMEMLVISHITSMATGVNKQSPKSHSMPTLATEKTFQLFSGLLNYVIEKIPDVEGLQC